MTTIAQLQAAGIPVTAAANGGPVETKTVVQNVDQLRSLLDVGLDQQGRQAHFEALFNGIQPAATGGAPAASGAPAGATVRLYKDMDEFKAAFQDGKNLEWIKKELESVPGATHSARPSCPPSGRWPGNAAPGWTAARKHRLPQGFRPCPC